MKDDFEKELRCESTGKICYTKREAGNAINGAKSHCNRSKKIPKRKYYCEECGCYHLTHYSHYGNSIKKHHFNKKLSDILLSEYKKLWQEDFFLYTSETQLTIYQ